jgi:hypothetical protein
MMLKPNPIYYEALNRFELDFLKQKAKKDSRVIYRLFKIMLLGAVIFSFGGAWQNITKGQLLNTETIFSWENYFITLATLTIIFLLSLRVLQSSELTNLKKDIRQKTKIVERVLIQKKTFLPHNNTFHFYLNSINKLSIEVKEQDFKNYSEGDEISIEYSKNSLIYLGYF